MQEQENKFEFSYSAPTEAERREIENIRAQYEENPSRREGKLERLRKLDLLVKNSAMAVGITLGVIGVLIFGVGMTMVLEWNLTLWGVLVGAVGVAPMAVAYPAYNAVLKKNKKKYGEEILRLAEELMPNKE